LKKKKNLKNKEGGKRPIGERVRKNARASQGGSRARENTNGTKNDTSTERDTY